ncbi:RNA exonuclease 1 homolog isoform X2 [Gouania willdenowi]|uniref:RNA exonuclease 1 homolog isoform X2 n=1 Tax=Gouania willdenowi TaxID=441366 RepID=UPI001054A54A|nr:RNA exonuclease 1 homolog isoform X2 [Gouania willdenowi]
MFPSSGLFHQLSCPTASCQRPYCFYQHGGTRESVCTADLTGVLCGQLYAAGRAPIRKEECLHELERINKEIETVTHLVEQERRRLSSYQNILATSRTYASHESGAAGQSVLSAHYSDPSSAARKDLTIKYVVDNTKPRTDLEYDPMSNYSSDLCSNHSSGKVQRTKSNEGLKEATPICDPKNTFQTNIQDSCSTSPDPFDESYKECELVIDVPPSPPKATFQAQKSHVSVGCKSSGKVNVVPTLSQVHFANATVSKDNQQSTSNGQKCETKIANRGVITQLESLATLQNKGKTSTLKSTEQVKKLDEHPTVESNIKYVPNNPQCEPPKKSLISPKANLQCSYSTEAEEKSSFVKRSAKAVMSKESSKGSGPTQNTDSITHSEQSSAICHTTTQKPSLKAVITCLSKRVEISSKNSEQLSIKTPTKEVIIISSDEEEGLKYSDMDLSDSDPMEECYRIFMEANEEESGKNDSDINVSTKVDDAVKPESNVASQVTVKRRVAHEGTRIEPLAKRRPQPQVLVPLRGKTASSISSYTSSTPRIQQAQQRASMVTGSVRGGQAFVSCKNKLETQSTSVPVKPTLQTIPTQHVGRTINVSNNLHLLLPEGAIPLPVDSSSGPVTSVLTPISRLQTSSYTANRAYLQSEVTSVQRNVPAALVLIPAPARKPSAMFNSTLPSSNVSSTTSPFKRKRKHQNEDIKDKVPHGVRQRYVNLFTEEFLKTTANVNEAFEKALAEEKMVYNRSMNKVKYQSVAVNVIKRLRSQSAFAAKSENKVNRRRLKGNTPLNPDMLKGTDDMALYECLKDYILTDEKLIESNYPIQHPEKQGCAILLNNKKVTMDPLKRICCRCGATYSVTQTGKHVRKEECTNHYGKGLAKRVPGGMETRYSCCEGIMGTPGCQVSELHVHDFISLEGFVTSPSGVFDTNCAGIFSLDCEMCYTIHGVELSRVTVVNSYLQVVFSGISEEEMKGNYPSLKEVQNTLLSFISADTILIGHGLETDLCLLKLLHGKVVDTKVVFPHRLGPPHTLSLKKITADYLRKIIQENVCGHDTEEDASACMELMLWKVKEDGKMKK